MGKVQLQDFNGVYNCPVGNAMGAQLGAQRGTHGV